MKPEPRPPIYTGFRTPPATGAARPGAARTSRRHRIGPSRQIAVGGRVASCRLAIPEPLQNSARGRVTCGLAGQAHAPGSRLMTLRLLYLIAIPGVRLAGAARPRPGVQGCGDHGAPAQGGGAAASGHPAEARLGRPGGPGRAGQVAAGGAASPAACHARNAADLAPPAGPRFMDLSESARAPWETSRGIRDLVLRPVRENPAWGTAGCTGEISLSRQWLRKTTRPLRASASCSRSCTRRQPAPG